MTSRFLAWTTGSLTVMLASTISAGKGLPDPNAPSTRTTLDQYCVGCHNDGTKTAGLALEGLDVPRAGEQPERGFRANRAARPAARSGLADAITVCVERLALEPADPYEAFIRVVDVHARAAQAAVRLVLAQPSI